MTKILFQRSSVLALALGLAACGGGGGGVATTPPPPPPPPPVTYTKLADLTGNQTFQSAGVRWDVDLSGAGQGFTNPAVQNFGSGPVLAYDATADSFTFTPTGGTAATFTQANFVAAQSSATREVYEKTTGSVTERLFLIVPSSGTVSLSYASFAIYNRTTTNATGGLASFTGQVGVGGVPTVQRDMPTTGTANYTFGIGGAANKSGTSYNLDGNSTATFAANFGAGTVSSVITVAGRTGPVGNTTNPLVNFGTATGSGNIASGGPAFGGAFTGTGDITSGSFSGAFFGPQAVEAAYEFFLLGTGFSAVGSGAGIKAP